MTVVHFQADADLNQAIVTGALRRQPNLSFQSAYTARLEGKNRSISNSSTRWESTCDPRS